MKLHFLPSKSDDAQEAFKSLTDKHGQSDLRGADAIVALGGDGTLLEALRLSGSSDIPIYGMNRGSVGFLMNAFKPDDILKKVENANRVTIHPLSMRATDTNGKTQQALAYNEVSLLREMRQAAKLSVSIDGVQRLPELICDGILVASPAGSTAYNLSAHGPIIPLSAHVLALTPISAFRPRRWRGALLPNSVAIRFDVLEQEKRPVSATADDFEVRNVKTVEVQEAHDISKTLLFDSDHSFEERILKEQFLS